MTKIGFAAPALLSAALLALGVGSVAAQGRLSGGEWSVTEIAGAKLPDDVVPTITFEPEAEPAPEAAGWGRAVSGHAGCNRYMGRAAQDGAALEIRPGGMTMMACLGDDRARIEPLFIETLGKVRSFALTPGGALELLGDEGLLIRATR